MKETVWSVGHQNRPGNRMDPSLSRAIYDVTKGVDTCNPQLLCSYVTLQVVTFWSVEDLQEYVTALFT